MYFQWNRTRRFFLSEIRGAITYLDYYVTSILDINPIYDDGFETDHLMTHEEFISEIENMNINSKRFERLDSALKYTRDKIEKARKEALTIPTFTSNDFHAVDKFLMKVSMFLSFYSWSSDEIDKPNISKELKQKLISVLNTAEENPFPNNLLDRVKKWQERKSFNFKREYQRHTRQDKAPEEDILPF